MQVQKVRIVLKERLFYFWNENCRLQISKCFRFCQAASQPHCSLSCPPAPSIYLNTPSFLSHCSFSSPFLHLASSPQAALQPVHSLPIIPRGAYGGIDLVSGGFFRLWQRERVCQSSPFLARRAPYSARGK